MYLEPKPPTAAFAKRTHVFKTSDGAELVGDLYTPGRTKPFSVVLLCGATAIPQEFYTHFAHFKNQLLHMLMTSGYNFLEA